MNELDLRNDFRTIYIKRAAISLLLILTVFTLIPLNEIQVNNGRYTEGYSFINPCEENIFYAINSYNQQGIDFEVIADYSLDLFPKIQNLKCINKINKIEKFDNFYEIRTSRSGQLEKLILFIFLILLLFIKDLKIAKFTVVIFFSFINLTYYGFSSLNFSFVLNLLLILLVVCSEISYFKEIKVLQISLIFFIFITHFYNFFRFRSSDEIYYIGTNFRSSSEFSAYFEQDFSEQFNNLITLFVNIFQDNFFHAIKIFHFLLFCYVILGFKNILKLSNYSIILFILFLFRFQGTFPTQWIIFNFTPAGLCNLLILIAFVQFFKSRFALTVITLSIATYFHFAYVVLLSPLFIYLAIRKLGFKKNLKYFILYFILSIFNLLKVFSSLTSTQNKNFYNDVYYYTTVRHPFNMPFDLSSSSYLKPLMPTFVKGFVYIFVGLSIMIIIKKFQNNIDIFIVDFTIFSYFLFFVYMTILNFLPVSYFSLPVPIRLNVFILFFSLLIILKSFEMNIFKYIRSRKGELFFLVFLLIYLTPFSLDLYNPIKSVSIQNNLSINYVHEGIAENDLVNKINEYDNDLIFLTVPATISNINRDFYDTLELSTQNPNYAVFKFVPHQLNLLPEWIERIKKSEAFFLEECGALNEIKPFYYILSKEDSLVNNCGELEYENNKYQIYLYK